MRVSLLCDCISNSLDDTSPCTANRFVKSSMSRTLGFFSLSPDSLLPMSIYSYSVHLPHCSGHNLGVVLGSFLSWKPHIQSISNLITSASQILPFLSISTAVPLNQAPISIHLEYLLLLLQNNFFKTHCSGFPGGAVVENLPANAGDMGSSPGLGRSHMPRSN